MLRSGKCQGSNVSIPFGGQTPPVAAESADVVGLSGKERSIEIGPEPGDENHHLGSDGRDHPVAMRNLHNTCVKPSY